MFVFHFVHTFQSFWLDDFHSHLQFWLDEFTNISKITSQFVAKIIQQFSYLLSGSCMENF